MCRSSIAVVSAQRLAVDAVCFLEEWVMEFSNPLSSKGLSIRYSVASAAEEEPRQKKEIDFEPS
jgi:hypothetical protein